MEKVNTEVFLKVVETGSFKAAADALGYTQAGVSYIVNAMEKELGLRLFDREYGGVRLSGEGKEILGEIEQVNLHERLLRAKADEIRSLDVGSVSVRSFSSVSVNWLPGIVEDFRREHPGVSVEIVSSNDDMEAEEMVASGSVDCGFFALPFHGKLDSTLLAESPLMVSVSPRHPMADKSEFPVSDLCSYPFIRMSYDDESHYLREVFDAAGGMPESSYVLDDDYAALAMASRDMGYCLFPEMALKNVPFELRHLPLTPRMTMKVCIGVRTMDACSHATRKFIHCASEWVERNVGRFVRE